ncbi:MAG TPA: D-aminopeptidase, partial [Caulobacteraceae bacterium]|nr:D-aminopeptidase [Caulobacteraceae bacterium]
MTAFSTRLDRALEALPRAYPGPGGAVAVLRDGEVLVRHAWGWANAERRIAFTPRTLFRMCSITKQFTCALVLDAYPDPSALDGEVRARLPRLEQQAPGALHLCHNQSGLRDYWALAMLHGSPAEAPFGDQEAGRVIAGARTLQFAPGTRYSYANQNFRILADILEARTGRGFGELLRDRIFDPAGMQSAFLAADTRAMPDGAQGYEGTQANGFRAAENRILWTGDAGIGTSLDDMIAWERWIDATRDDAGGLYRRLCAPVAFADGAGSEYGFGLGRRPELKRAVTGHGGALRGWRSHRLYARSERISVVVMFNHLADAHDAAVDLFAAVLDEDRPPSAG